MSESQVKIAKWAVGILWLLLAATFFMPASGLRTAGQVLFWVLLVSHAGECVAYWRAMRATGNPIALEVVQVLLFGIVHYQTIKARATGE